jgi:hypothetical protein
MGQREGKEGILELGEKKRDELIFKGFKRLVYY